MLADTIGCEIIIDRIFGKGNVNGHSLFIEKVLVRVFWEVGSNIAGDKSVNDSIFDEQNLKNTICWWSKCW